MRTPVALAILMLAPGLCAPQDRMPVNIPGTSASLRDPNYVALDGAGNLFFADRNHVVLRLDSRTGVVTLVAGTGESGYSGDNGPATSARLAHPQGVAVDSVGNLYIADTLNACIRKVSNGVITTVAGNGTRGFPQRGDNGPATSAQLNIGLLLSCLVRMPVAVAAVPRHLVNGPVPNRRASSSRRIFPFRLSRQAHSH